MSFNKTLIDFSISISWFFQFFKCWASFSQVKSRVQITNNGTLYGEIYKFYHSSIYNSTYWKGGKGSIRKKYPSVMAISTIYAISFTWKIGKAKDEIVWQMKIVNKMSSNDPKLETHVGNIRSISTKRSWNLCFHTEMKPLLLSKHNKF